MKTIVKKIIAAVFTVVIIATMSVSLSACGEDEKAAENARAQQAAELEQAEKEEAEKAAQEEAAAQAAIEAAKPPKVIDVTYTDEAGYTGNFVANVKYNVVDAGSQDELPGKHGIDISWDGNFTLTNLTQGHNMPISIYAVVSGNHGQKILNGYPMPYWSKKSLICHMVDKDYDSRQGIKYLYNEDKCIIKPSYTFPESILELDEWSVYDEWRELRINSDDSNYHGTGMIGPGKTATGLIKRFTDYEVKWREKNAMPERTPIHLTVDEGEFDQVMNELNNPAGWTMIRGNENMFKDDGCNMFLGQSCE